MSLEYVFNPGGPNELSLDESQIISQNPIKTHTGKADARARVAYNRDLEDYAQRQDRVNINIDNSTEWTGYLIGVSHNEQQAQTSLRLDGIAKKLEETRPDYDSLGGSLTYTNTALEDAIDDYWGRTPFDNHSVTTQTTNSVATDENVQSLSTTNDFNGAVSIPDDRPFRIQSDQLQLAQTSFTQEGENFASGTDTAFNLNDDDASNGETAIVGTTSTSQEYNYTFTLDHSIPAEDFDFGVRWTAASGDTTEVADINWLLDGEQIATYAPGTTGGYQWRGSVLSTPNGTAPSSNLSAGQHTLTADCVDTGIAWYIDVIQPYDDGGRFGGFTYNWDNTLNQNQGYLDGPELYPDGVSVTWDALDVSYNITAARVDSEWIDDDTSGSQQIELSNDDGTTWESFSNQEDGTVSFTSSNGRTITARTTHDRYGTTTGQTPLTGINGQAIDTWDLYLDGDDLVVIDTIELSRNHFDNLQTLHDYGDFNWVIEHDGGDISNMTVASFQRGDETRPQPDGFDLEINQNPEVQGGSYFNTIFLQGALDSNGNRPTAEVKDQTAINNDGREISPGVLRDFDVTTDAGATFRARALLDAATQNNQLRGTITVPPNEFAHPGYAYPVDFTGDGSTQNKTAEEVALTENPNNVQIRYDFSVQEDISEQIEELRRNARGQGDQV